MTGRLRLFALIVCTASIFLVPTASSGYKPAFVEPLSTERLQQILQDPINRSISSLNIHYVRRDIVTGEHIRGNFRYVPYTANNRQWYFDAIDNTGQKYEYKLPNEALYKSLIQLCIANEVCEMQDYTGPGFDPDASYHKLFLTRMTAEAPIGYNVRDAESEPFFEVVDYIELNFVQPALLNPVAKWWWEE